MTLMEKMIIIMVIGIWLAIVILLRSCSKMATSKKEYYNALTEKETKPMDMVSRVNITASMLKLIDTLVAIEIDNRLIVMMLIKTPYNMLQLDKDIEVMSKRVFTAINRELFDDPNLCLNQDYILQFISTQISNKFIQAMLTTNIQLYTEKAEDDSNR